MIRTIPHGDGKRNTYRVTVGDSPQRSFTTKADAVEYEAALKASRRRERAGMEVEKGAITFADLHTLWAANFTPSAWRLQMAQHSLDRWGSTMVRSIQPEGVGRWLHSRPCSEKTKSHILQTFRQILNSGVEWGYLSKSPARPRAFKAPSEKRVRPIRPFESMAEVDAVCFHLSAEGEELVRFAVATGIRLPGEALSLRWSDISTARKEAQIQGTKTENAPRTIPLSVAAMDALGNLPHQITGKVFSLNYHYWRKEEWPKALAAAGLEYRTPYECRHTFATLALQAGASLDDVAEVLGHADISITRRYYRKWTRPMADRLRGVLDSIGKEQDDQRADELR